MIRTEGELAAVAYALVGKAACLTPQEQQLIPKTYRADKVLLAEIRAAIFAGGDPLGASFCHLRSAENRRAQGATYTPQAIVDAMISWAVAEHNAPARIVDAGAGSGRFTIAAAKAFPAAALIAVELDPLATLMLRANATVLGFAERLTVVQVDYRHLALPEISHPTLYIGNPPYVRHHDIAPSWKVWLAETAEALGFSASGLSGLHIHFFLKTRAIASPGDFGAFITASEWLDVNYGSVLRKMLADGLGGTAVHVIDPQARPFADALTTGAITCFRVGRQPNKLVMRIVDSLDELGPLSQGRKVDWSELTSARRWSVLIRGSTTPAGNRIELGELFRVHRGQVSGNNAVWVAGEIAKGLPARFLFPTITRARELFQAGNELHESDHLKRVIDLPADLSCLTVAERRAVDCFLAWAKNNRGDQGWITTHRRAWWAVNLRAPAPILCTYMARRAPAFVRNHAGARHLNIAHGLYPVEPLSDEMLSAIISYLRRTVGVGGGRTYAGGLVKYEPGEVERLHIPSLADITAA
jgi:adenine-specific DNA-methyltransferase